MAGLKVSFGGSFNAFFPLREKLYEMKKGLWDLIIFLYYLLPERKLVFDSVIPT